MHNMIKCGNCGDVKWHGDSMPSITLKLCDICKSKEESKMTLVQLEQLEQLKKVTWDGDIIGATARDYLVAHGFAERYNGWNFITKKGVQELLDIRVLYPGMEK